MSVEVLTKYEVPEITVPAANVGPLRGMVVFLAGFVLVEAVGKVVEAIGKVVEAVGKVIEAVGEVVEAVGEEDWLGLVSVAETRLGPLANTSRLVVGKIV